MMIECGKLDDSAVFYTSMTVVPEDQIFPDALELCASGFVARDAPGSRGTELKFLFQFRYNTAKRPEDLQAFASDLVSWFNNFLDAAAHDLGSQTTTTTTAATTTSFQMPNRGSMVFDDFHHLSFQSMDLSSNLPKLPSFSSLNLPPIVLPEKNDVARSIDVVVPAGRTLTEYWQGAFSDSETPILVLPAALDRVEFFNDKLEVLLGVTGELSPAVLGPRDSLDFTLLEGHVANIVNQRKQFFVHFFTFFVG